MKVCVRRSGEASTCVLCGQTRLKDKGQLCSRVTQELELVETVSVPESLAWMRDSFRDLLCTVMTWHTEIESALEKCQVNVKISEERKLKSKVGILKVLQKCILVNTVHVHVGMGSGAKGAF